MGTRDPRIDAYIAKQREFARPVLEHLRELVHAACPDVEETMKWSSPHFDYKGQMMCGMAAFKEHCAFGFWKGPLIFGPKVEATRGGRSAGNLGRITSVKDLPGKREETKAARVKQAVEWIAEGKQRNWKYMK